MKKPASLLASDVLLMSSIEENVKGAAMISERNGGRGASKKGGDGPR